MEVRRFDFAAGELQEVRNRDALMASVMASDRTPLLSEVAHLATRECVDRLRPGLPPLLASSIARFPDNGLRATFRPAVHTWARKYSSPYWWKTRRLLVAGFSAWLSSVSMTAEYLSSALTIRIVLPGVAVKM